MAGADRLFLGGHRRDEGGEALDHAALDLVDVGAREAARKKGGYGEHTAKAIAERLDKDVGNKQP